MTRGRSGLFVAAALIGGLAWEATPSARADVLYDFITTSANGPTLGVSIDLADTAVQSGHFALSGTSLEPSGGPPTVYQGDTNELHLLSISVAGDTWRIDDEFHGAVNLDLTFDSSGVVTSSALDFSAYTEGARLRSESDRASGMIGSDRPYPGAGTPYCDGVTSCAVSGVWADPAAPVPEPASVAVLGMGLIALGWTLRRPARRRA